MSGEDLTTQPGLSLQQDLALASMLGLTHLERNGHHYVDGMISAPPEEQQAFLNSHPDLYARHSRGVRLQIANGTLSFRSLQCAGFGVNTAPSWDSMTHIHQASSHAIA